MKKRYALFLLTCFITVGIITNAAAIDDENDYNYINRRQISPGLIYTQSEAMDKNDNKQSIYTFELFRDSDTKLDVSYGKYIYGAETLSSIVKQKEEEGNRVAAAVNADFFSTVTGVPMSLILSDGEVMSSDDNHCGLGVTSDGEYIIGNPKMKFNLKKRSVVYETNENGEAFPSYVTEDIDIEYLNKYPSVYAKYILTDKFAETTKTKSSSTEIVFRKYTEKYELLPEGADSSAYTRIGDFYYLLSEVSPRLFESEGLVVTEVRKNAVDGQIPKGSYVLCLDDISYLSEAEKFFVGDEAVLTVSASEEWHNVTDAVGNGGRIIRNSMYTDESYDSAVFNSKSPRTAAGITSEGNLVVMAIDGRHSLHSTGMTVPDLADELLKMDCTDAVNFDGGGSTTVYAALPGKSFANLENQPSDNSERRISNALLFVNTAKPTQNLMSVRMYPEVNLLLSGGAGFTISELLGFDDNYYPTSINGAVKFFAYENALRFDGSRVYSTDVNGEIEVYADIDGEFYPCGVVNVLESVDRISIDADKTLLKKDETAMLNVGAVFSGRDIPCVLSSFTYNDGSLSQNYIPNSEYVIKTANIEVTVDGAVRLLRFDEPVTLTTYYGDTSASIVFSEAVSEIIVEDTDFVDISLHWAENYINRSRELNLMKGEATEYGTMFFPERNFSVAEFCTVVARLKGYDLLQYADFPLPFDDKDDIADWALPYIKAMYFNGRLDLIIENNRINSKSPITRAQVMTVCGTLCPMTENNVLNFSDLTYTDFNTIPQNIAELKIRDMMLCINRAVDFGIFDGFEDNTLRPNESLTRAQGAVVFVRLFEKLLPAA